MSRLLEIEDDDVGPAPSGNVIRLPGLSDIPQPDMHLGPIGLKKYEEWCRALLAASALDFNTKGLVESYAVSCDLLNKAAREGKATRAPLEMQGKALRMLQKLIVNGNVAQTGSKNKGTYDTFGFARRAGKRRHSPD